MVEGGEEVEEDADEEDAKLEGRSIVHSISNDRLVCYSNDLCAILHC